MFDQNDQIQTQSPSNSTDTTVNTPAQSSVQPQMSTPDPITSTAPVTPDPIQNIANDIQSSFNATVIEPPTTADDVAAPATVTTTPDPISPSPGIELPTKPPEDANDLLSIKQEALQNLSPLLSQLDQNPEEKFRTTMMLIQASDNQSLIHEAYSAAKEIEDEKVRAQALLDIVNEINYFTQHKPEATEAPTT